MSSEGKRCQICGDDHPPMAPHRPGEIQRLASEVERLEKLARERRGDALWERTQQAEAEVERLTKQRDILIDGLQEIVDAAVDKRPVSTARLKRLVDEAAALHPDEKDSR